MIINILQLIFGLAFTLFIPGFLITRLIFPKVEILESIVFSIVFSIALDIVIGLFLGLNETMANLTGGITELNLWFYLGFITLILLVLNLLKKSEN